MTANNYNNVAPYYDILERLVFGNALTKAKIHFLNRLAKKGNILLIGGGTGMLVSPLLGQSHSTTIYFVEKSEKMLESAARKIPTHQKNRVKLLHGDENVIPEFIKFDTIITNFFLDQFTEQQLIRLISILYNKLLPNGQWLYTDFVLEKQLRHFWWQMVLVQVMHIFFKITTNLSSKRLININPYFDGLKLSLMGQKKYYKDLVVTSIYERG